jgi:hypothetical protein
MDIYRFERNGARENAGSNPEDVSTGEGMAATLSGMGNTKPLVRYGTQSPESVRSSVGEIEDKVPHDAFSVLMATSIVPELIYLYIPMGLVSMKVASSSLYSSSNLSGDCDCCHHSVRSSVGEIEDKVPCRDTYPFEGNWVKENTGSGVEGALIWTEDRAPHQEWGNQVSHQGFLAPLPGECDH